jgi:ParB family chromosome partitioning protein
MDVLALRDSAKEQLQMIRDVETGVEYLNKVRAIEVWAKAEKKDALLQNMIAEQKIRTQRILGELIQEGQERGEIRKQNDNQYNASDKKELADLGISRKESSTFQQIANIPSTVFESFIEEKKTAVDDAVAELTTSGILAFAKGKPHVANNSGENEWYTPKHIIEAARMTMGSIDLDPATSLIANETVKAEQIFTKEDNGLNQKWSGNIWMNPPYAQPLISLFSDKLISELPHISQACVLVNNATETNWFQNMLIECDYVCFLNSRVKFIDMNGNPSGAPLQGQAVLYFGGNRKEFYNNFYDLGICLMRLEEEG